MHLLQLSLGLLYLGHVSVFPYAKTISRSSTSTHLSYAALGIWQLSSQGLQIPFVSLNVPATHLHPPWSGLISSLLVAKHSLQVPYLSLNVFFLHSHPVLAALTCSFGRVQYSHESSSFLNVSFTHSHPFFNAFYCSFLPHAIHLLSTTYPEHFSQMQ